MIACFAWTNSQIINITNAKLNIYADEPADLYIRMGRHISSELIAAVKSEHIFENIYCMDPLNINYNKLLFGKIKHIRGLFVKRALRKAYRALLDKLCYEKEYTRVITSWFYTENVYLIDYWAHNSKQLPITFIDEGTGSYCLNKKDMYYPFSLIRSRKEQLKKLWNEGALVRKYSRNVDSICLYRPDYCRPDIDYKKYTLPVIDPETNPIMHRVLCSCIGLDYTHFIRYNKRDIIYFTTYSTEGVEFDKRSLLYLESIIDKGGERNVITKVHTGNTNHCENFAKSYEDKIFVDRERYIFEGLYAQLEDQENKVLLSCMSSATINPKFMFNKEPYIIFTYRLYDGYRQEGVERDDWMAEKLIDAYEDKSRIMIPNSMFELNEMIENTVFRIRSGKLSASEENRQPQTAVPAAADK